MNRYLLNNRVEKQMLLLFILSFVSSITFIVYLLFLCFQGMKDATWRLKGLIWISLRTIVNYQVATVGNGVVQMTKWGAIFFLATLLISFHDDNNDRNGKINRVVGPFILLGIYIVFQSVLFSGYPLTSIFKVFSYLYIFIAVIVGIGKLNQFMDVSSYMYYSIRLMMIFSILIFPIRSISFSTAALYQGFMNQTNMYGLIAALFFACFYYQLMKKKCQKLDIAIAIVTIVLVIFSGSRNGMLTILIMTMIYFLISDYSVSVKVSIATILIVAIGFIFSVSSDLRNEILSFIYKVDDIEYALNTNRDVFVSREIQWIQFNQKFSENKWFGTGFSVPYNGGVQDWTLYFSLIVESGNLIYAILGDIGIVGLICFLVSYFQIWRNRVSKRSLILFIAPFSVCIGEMVFFSTNNMAMLLYIMFGLVLFDSEEEVKS